MPPTPITRESARRLGTTIWPQEEIREITDKRLEWEHVMPAARIGRGRDCYEQREMFPKCFKANGKLRSRRECCQKVDAGFKMAHNDLHNLTPR